MEKWKNRQANLFEARPRVTELPMLKRGKALMLLASLLTEALATAYEDEETTRTPEAGNDENHG